MSAPQRTLSRFWVPIVGGSCDLRMGEEALQSAGKLMRDAVGRPHTCMLVTHSHEDAALVEQLTHQAVDAGFLVEKCEVADPVCSLVSAQVLSRALLEARCTVDDLCCVVGRADLISIVSFVAGSWCHGMSVVAVPLDEVALLEGALVPRALDVGNAKAMMAVRPAARHALIDLDKVFGPLDEEPARMFRVLATSAALGSAERDFSELWDRSELLMANDVETRRVQLVATAKQRGTMAGSTAAAVRSGLVLGQTFAQALAMLEPGASKSGCLAEGLRFCARLSVAQEKLPLDDMLALDELLDLLGIVPMRATVRPEVLLDALSTEKRLRSRRRMWEIPLAMGRVRLATVDDEMLEEHVHAWCASHCL